MPRPGLPETDLHRIERFCAGSVPPELHDRLRVEHHVRASSVTLCETRPSLVGAGEWTHTGFAQLRNRAASSDWALYWADRNSRWHEH